MCVWFTFGDLFQIFINCSFFQNLSRTTVIFCYLCWRQGEHIQILSKKLQFVELVGSIDKLLSTCFASLHFLIADADIQSISTV